MARSYVGPTLYIGEHRWQMVGWGDYIGITLGQHTIYYMIFKLWTNIDFTDNSTSFFIWEGTIIPSVWANHRPTYDQHLQNNVGPTNESPRLTNVGFWLAMVQVVGMTIANV